MLYHLHFSIGIRPWNAVFFSSFTVSLNCFDQFLDKTKNENA